MADSSMQTLLWAIFGMVSLSFLMMAWMFCADAWNWYAKRRR